MVVDFRNHVGFGHKLKGIDQKNMGLKNVDEGWSIKHVEFEWVRPILRSLNMNKMNVKQYLAKFWDFYHGRFTQYGGTKSLRVSLLRSVDGPLLVASGLSQLISSTRSSQLLVQRAPVGGDLQHKIVTETLLIWVWVNTYENTIYQVGWTSIDPSYFDVNRRGTRFWPIPIW